MSGMGEHYSQNGTTVMNQFSPGGQDDPAQNVPTFVTSCDGNQAFQAQYYVGGPPPP